MRITKTYAMLWVADMDRASRFYQKALGLKQEYGSPAWTELRPAERSRGESVIALHTGRPHVPQRHSGLGFAVDDLDSACTSVVAAHGRVVAEPLESPEEGIRMADCADTEGNRFSLSERL